jgi:hypothetical protein
LPNGKVLIAGGDAGIETDAGALAGFSYLASAELYDPADETFAPTGSMNAGRGAHTATLLPGGKVLIAGGYDGNTPAGVTSAELYDPAAENFVRTGGKRPQRQGHTATLLADGRVLVAGGVTVPASQSELFDPTTGAFTTAAPLLVPTMDGRSATLLLNNNVLFTGGRDFQGMSTPRAELYDPVTGSVRALGDMTTGRAFHTATLLPDGRVLIAGANNYDGGGSPGLASAELYGANQDGLACRSVTYPNPGCSAAATPVCEPDASAAIAIAYCGCDGTTLIGGFEGPTAPYQYKGCCPGSNPDMPYPCSFDAGVTAAD